MAPQGPMTGHCKMFIEKTLKRKVKEGKASEEEKQKIAALEEKLNSLANQITSSTVSSSNTSLTVSNSTPASSSANMERIRHVGYHLRKAELDQLGLPYCVKQGYFPTVEEVLELERYMMHSRLLIGFHPITMDDVQTTK